MPKLFTSATKRQIEKYVAYLLTDTCTIEQQVRSRNQYGAETDTWEVVARDVQCRIIRNGQTVDSQTEMIGGQERIVNQPRIIAPRGTAFAANQRITMSTGEVFTITGVKTSLTDNVMAEAFCVKA